MFSESDLNYTNYIILRESKVTFIPINRVVHNKTDGFLRCMRLTCDCGGMPISVYHFIARIGR